MLRGNPDLQLSEKEKRLVTDPITRVSDDDKFNFLSKLAGISRQFHGKKLVHCASELDALEKQKMAEQAAALKKKLMLGNVKSAVARGKNQEGENRRNIPLQDKFKRGF